MRSKPEHMHRDYPYTDNCTVDHRAVALEGVLASDASRISAGRLDMFSKHLYQAYCLINPDFPNVFKGYECKLAPYDHSNLWDTIKEESIVIEKIPKYGVRIGANPISYNGIFYLVYQSTKDKTIDYLEISEYTKGSDGYGFKNRLINEPLMMKDHMLFEGTKFTRSSMEPEDGVYCLGREAVTAIMTLPGTVEDSIVVRRGWIEENTTYTIHTEEINIPYYRHPIFLYDPEANKFLPDLGDFVGEDGILAAFRQSNEHTFMSDTLDINIGNVSPFHDIKFTAPPGAQVIDIDVWKNHLPKGKIKYNNEQLYSQLDKYIEATKQRYRRIIKIYEEYKDTCKFTDKFETLVTTAYKYLISSRERVNGIYLNSNTNFIDKDEEIDYIKVKITYCCKVVPNLGSKFTGREGSKGIVSVIGEDEDMPVDDYGIVADIVISPLSIPGRMNSVILDEQFINRTSMFVLAKLKENRDFEYLMEYCELINANYADLLREKLRTPELQQRYIDELIRHDSIYLNIPPFQEGFDDDFFLHLEEKYGSYSTPVTFNIVDEDGTKKKQRTAAPICLGSRYIYTLYAKPEPTSAGFGKVNHFGIPIKSTSKRSDSHVKKTPVKVIGQDELRLLNAGTVRDVIFRTMNLLANSPDGYKKVIETLLTHPSPSRINQMDITDEELRDSNVIIKMIRHEFATFGIDMKDLKVPGFSEEKLAKLIEDILGEEI